MSQKQTRMKFGSFRITEDFTERVRDVKRKLVPHLKQLKQEHRAERDFRCFLHFDKLNNLSAFYTQFFFQFYHFFKHLVHM